MSDPSPRHDGYARAIRRGTVVNFLGGIAKLAQPLYVLSITWLWGPSVFGMYVLGQSLVEVISAGITSGYADATTIFASRHVDRAREEPEERAALYRVLANTFGITALLSVLVFLATLAFARPLIERNFAGYKGLLPGVYLLALSLLPRSLGTVAIAATKAMLRMEPDALLNGLFQPLAMLLGCVVTYLLGGELTALLGVHLVVDAVFAFLALRLAARDFAVYELAHAFREFRFDRALLDFAIPQSFNLTFNRYVARLDGIMLASFGLDREQLGYFGTAAMLTGNLGQIRVAFSGALAPVVARHHRSGDRRALQDVFGQVVGWTTSLSIPVILLCVVLRHDILHLLSRHYGADSLFVAVLLIPPFTNCAYGMAGACLMFTGHTRAILANSLCVAALNTGFTYLLIPRYGMLGAALATLLATSITTSLQVVELWRLERIKIPLRRVWKPHLAGLLCLALVLACWDPVELSGIGRTMLSLAVTLGYAGVLLILGHQELVGLVKKIARRATP